MSKTALYRHFDADGALLYVGITKSAMRRLAEHLSGSGWVERVATVRIEWFASRAEAVKAERAAIRDECPAFNVVGRAMRPVPAGKLADDYAAFVAEVERFCAEYGTTPESLCRRATGNPRKWGRLVGGMKSLSHDFERIRAAMGDLYPVRGAA